MDIELPSSAVAVLHVTHESLFSQRKLPYKERRKLWKKYKRKKARIINHFALLKLHDSSLNESNYQDNNEYQSDLPEGPLTNAVVIQYLKSLKFSKSTEVVGILRNADAKLDSNRPTLDEVEPVTQAVENISSSPVDFSSTFSVSKKTQVTDTVLTEEPTRPDHETDEITRLLAELDDEVEQWQNPSPPSNYQPPMEANETMVGLSNRPTENNTSLDLPDDSRPACSFYSKTGACRFGSRCSKKHETISSSNTLVFINMFSTFLFDLEDRLRVSGDAHDLSLEHSEQDLYEEFVEFYFDIQPEFRDIGKISHLYVCKNRCHHLRGNVYVQYLSKNDAKTCFDKMYGRYFGGKPLVCSYVNISSWDSTLCGIDVRTGKCSRGGQCNYLHVFKSPGSKKYEYSDYAKKNCSPHAHQSKLVKSGKRTSNGRLKHKISKHSPSTHDRPHEKYSKVRHRRSRSKHSHSRSRSPNTSARSETDTFPNSRHELSMEAIKTLKIAKHPFAEDMHSLAESDNNDHNSYRRKIREKKTKKKKKKHRD